MKTVRIQFHLQSVTSKGKGGGKKGKDILVYSRALRGMEIGDSAIQYYQGILKVLFERLACAPKQEPCPALPYLTLSELQLALSYITALCTVYSIQHTVHSILQIAYSALCTAYSIYHITVASKSTSHYSSSSSSSSAITLRFL